jgi:hypothetical protein
MTRSVGVLFALLGLALIGVGFWTITGALQARVEETAATLAETRAEAAALTAGAAPEGLSLPAAALTVEGEGALTDVLAFLDALERQPPRLGLSQLMLSSRDATGRVSLRLTAWGVLDGGAG